MAVTICYPTARKTPMPSPAQLLQVIHLQTDIARLGLDLGNVMNLVAERTLSLTDADGAAIELAEDGDMVYRAVSGSARSALGLRISGQGSLSGLCVSTGEALRCDDSETDPRVDREACRRVGLRAMIVLPLKHRGATVGVLKAMSTRPAAFGDADTGLLGLLSEVVGAAMFYATKYETDDLFHQATHDALTGLANRALFMDRLRNTLSRSGRESQPVDVLMIDMDGLKPVNDSRGHRVGDAVLREFANRLRRGTRSSDTVARLGGDEFAVLLSPGVGPAGAAVAVARLYAALEAPLDFENHSVPLRASIGLAHSPDDGGDADELLERADERMYRSKQQRREGLLREERAL